MRSSITIIASVIASCAITAGLSIKAGWVTERHIPVNSPAGIAWIDNTSDGIAVRAQCDQGTAIEAIGNVDIFGTVRIADGTEGNGKVLISRADGTAHWVTPPATQSPQYAVFVDQKPANEGGGTFNSGAWITRDLNTATALSGDAIALDANTSTITLAPGTYYVEASAPTGQVKGHQIRLRNVTRSSTVIVGTAQWNDDDATYDSSDRSFLTGYVTVEGPNVEEFHLEHRCVLTEANKGFGRPAGFDEPNIYSIVHIRKVN